MSLYFCKISTLDPALATYRSQIIQKTKDFMCPENALGILKPSCLHFGSIITHQFLPQKNAIVMDSINPDQVAPQEALRRLYQEYEYASLYDDDQWRLINTLIIKERTIDRIFETAQNTIKSKQRIKKYIKRIRKLLYQKTFSQKFVDIKNQYIWSLTQKQREVYRLNFKKRRRQCREELPDLDRINQAIIKILKCGFKSDIYQWKSLTKALTKAPKRKNRPQFFAPTIQNLLSVVTALPKIQFVGDCFRIVNLSYKVDDRAGAPSTLLRLALFVFDGFLYAYSSQLVNSEIKQKFFLLTLIITCKLVCDGEIYYSEFLSCDPKVYPSFQKAESWLATLLDLPLNYPFEGSDLPLTPDLENWFVEMCQLSDFESVCHEFDADWRAAKYTKLAQG